MTSGSETEQGTHARWARWALVGIIVAYVAVSLWLFDRCLDDDAYISFRYARHLVEGHGLVYNVGERVEGYTNFLWVMITAGAMWMGAAPDVAVQLVGIACGVGSLLLLWRLARPHLGPWWALLAPGLCVVVLPFAVENLLGLEIPLYSLLGLLGIAVVSGEGRRKHALGGGVFALAAMTRPEAMALFALTFVPELGTRPWPWKAWIERAGAFALVFGPFLAWRWSYYGYPLPNTFYAKTGGGTMLWRLGAEYVGRALVHVGPIALVGLMLVSRRREGEARVARPFVLAGVFAMVMLVYLVSIGGDFRPHFRFFVPLVPWLALCAAAGAERVARRGGALVTAGVMAAGLLWAGLGMRGPAMTWVHYRDLRNPQLFAVGQVMKEIAPPGSLMAISGGGIVPWVSELPAIEMWGLTDVHIARVKPRVLVHGVPGHLKGDGAYILTRKPRYVLFIAIMYTRRAPSDDEIAVRLAAPSEVDLWGSAEFRRDYVLRSLPVPVPGKGGVVNFFERVAE